MSESTHPPVKNSPQQNLDGNPFLEENHLKNRALPFDKIHAEHFLPALELTMEHARQGLDKIKKNEPSFESTILELETLQEEMKVIASCFFNFLGANTNETLQELAGQIAPLLSRFDNDIILDEVLFQKVKAVYEKEREGMGDEEKKLTEEIYLNFTRNGANLNVQDKEALRKIDEELAGLSPKFTENVLKATNAYDLNLTEKEDIEGLPDFVLEAAESLAESKQQKGWTFTLQAPSYVPFMKYAAKRNLRETLWKAFSSRSFGGSFDNQDIILKLVQLKQKRAKLLGFPTFANFVLSQRMAETPENVMDFLKNILEKAKPAAQRDVEELQQFAISQGGPDKLQAWDFAYYSEKLKKQKFHFSEEDLKPYFPLEKVIDGVFLHAEKLYGLKFQPSFEYPVYHEEVKVYEVSKIQNDEFIGLFYADFFPRESKSGGAWMTNYVEQGLFQGRVHRPHVSIVCNFTKPTATKPSLLTFEEVQTLFHEFGHALHGLLSQCTFQSLGGTNVYWDFVELPSQILENWTFEKESLKLFAKHYETGEPIPDELIEKLKQSSQFMEGYATLRQLNFSYLDMAWHFHKNPEEIKSVSEFEQQATQNTQVFHYVEGTNSSCAFSHIFGGGYSAGYYSYKWAEVLDADAFELFQERGIFDKEVAHQFLENILSRGGTEHPMELYKKFRGREPQIEALLRRSGLI